MRTRVSSPEREHGQKKRRGFPRLSKQRSVPACDYGIEIAAPELSYQYSFNVAGNPLGEVVVSFA